MSLHAIFWPHNVHKMQLVLVTASDLFTEHSNSMLTERWPNICINKFQPKSHHGYSPFLSRATTFGLIHLEKLERQWQLEWERKNKTKQKFSPIFDNPLQFCQIFGFNFIANAVTTNKFRCKTALDVGFIMEVRPILILLLKPQRVSCNDYGTSSNIHDVWITHSLEYPTLFSWFDLGIQHFDL